MNIILKAKTKMFMKSADNATKSIMQSLLQEIDRIEQDRSDRELRYRNKYDELNKEMYYWQDRFYLLYYPDA